ncbi:hypothetical protein Y032_0008g296 [Ancylostoma ceylanicum]|uniref:Uncharacterized protein n=1 Tax=Ancylostoma ceylanicum TaxID=53326 RepID=A0A016VMQ8_9BILA|nr:hypothetical protein Y032_0008g296 [Ancylostoma ceylanicum]
MAKQEFEPIDYLGPVVVAAIFAVTLFLLSFFVINFFCITKYDDFTQFEKANVVSSGEQKQVFGCVTRSTLVRCDWSIPVRVALEAFKGRAPLGKNGQVFWTRVKQMNANGAGVRRWPSMSLKASK